MCIKTKIIYQKRYERKKTSQVFKSTLFRLLVGLNSSNFKIIAIIDQNIIDNKRVSSMNLIVKKPITTKARIEANDAIDIVRINVDELSLMVLTPILIVLYKMPKKQNIPIIP